MIKCLEGESSDCAFCSCELWLGDKWWVKGFWIIIKKGVLRLFKRQSKSKENKKNHKTYFNKSTPLDITKIWKLENKLWSSFYKPTFFSPQRQITIFLGFALNWSIYRTGGVSPHRTNTAKVHCVYTIAGKYFSTKRKNVKEFKTCRDLENKKKASLCIFKIYMLWYFQKGIYRCLRTKY